MSLEQLMLLASQLAQAPRPVGVASAPAAESKRGHHGRAGASVTLTAEELEALQQIWAPPTPSRPIPSSHRVYH